MRFDQVGFETAFGTKQQLTASTLPEVVFAGRSNVGKSSLINKLFNRKALARVSGKPGKTITINFFRGDGVRFVDLPGYGYAKTSHAEKQRWEDMLEYYFDSGRNICLVVQIVDMRHQPSEQDFTMLTYLAAKNIPFMIVATKSDKLKPTERKRREAELADELAAYADKQIVYFSAVSGEGVEALQNIIEQAAH